MPELQDMEEKGYFTKQEIREIVRKRENFEYALKRKMPAKADFLRCADFMRGFLNSTETHFCCSRNRQQTQIYQNAPDMPEGDTEL